MASLFPFSYQQNIPLRGYSTFGIGGPAAFFTQAATTLELQKMVKYCFQTGRRYFILGKGSNCLFDDQGFDGLVILNRIDFLQQQQQFFHVGAGYSFPRLGSQTARLGFSGLEFAAGIPATVGGAIYMNAGAGAGEISQTLKEVLFIKNSGEAEWIGKEKLSFAYRFSSFQNMRGAIAEAIFELAPSELAKTMQQQLLEYRLKTQPYGEKSAGCVFRNLQCSSAGALIDRSGLKGMSVGDAQVSAMHANFIVNRGQARSADVLNLIKIVKNRVHAQHGMKLEEEIRLVPFKDESFSC